MSALALRGGAPGFDRSPFAWAPAIAASLLANALLVALLLIAIEPDSVPFKDEIRTRFQLSALDVPSQRAEAEDTRGEAAEEAQTSGEQLAVRSVPSSRARPVDPLSNLQQAAAPASAAAQIVQPGGESLSAARNPGRRLESAAADSALVAARDALGERAAVAVPAAAKVAASPAAGRRARSLAPSTEVQVAQLPRAQTASAVRPNSERKTAATASGPRLTAAAPAARAVAVKASGGQRALSAAPAALAVAAATAGSGERLVSRAAPANKIPAATAPVRRSVAAQSSGARLTAVSRPEVKALPAAVPADSVQNLASAAPRTERSAAVEPGAERLADIEAAGPALASVAPDAAPAEAARTEGQALASRSSASLAGAVAPTSTASAATATRAAVAWSGGSNMQLDEQSLAAIQSFMQPGEVAQSAAFGGSVKDGIGAALAQFPCSRLQAAFQPESGTLEIRGHVPVPALKADVVAMLERSVGGAIPVGSSLLVLPAPQCGVLDAAEGLGFVQSRDQENDPLEVGKEAQAQILSFEEAQRVVFALQAPEFDAYIYVDYFDKDGTVVHVLPNDFVQDNRFAANESFSLGDGSGAGGGLEMRVAPPFSQDIAVVLGTTHPLYDRPRPLQEDAESYLSWLRNRIRDLRSEEPEFRGEWAYLFVRTGPKGAFN